MMLIFFKTYGCQANVADSEGLMSYLRDLGCVKVETEAEADLIFVNSCAVREKAEQKMFSYLGSLAEFKRQRPYLRIGVIGCVASYKKKEIFERFTHINFIHGAREQVDTLQHYLMDVITSLETTKQLFLRDPDTYHSHGGQDRDIKKKIANENVEQNPTAISPEQTEKVALGAYPQTSKLEVNRSFINIMTGCNNFCAFCIVPFTRGREKSYALSHIVERVSREVAEGAKEVTLIGQNVNSYCCPETGAKFAKLLEAVALVPGEFWVRYVSPHPKDMTVDVLEVMAKYPEKLCPWIHLPLQSGSDRILKAMNRTYTVERYLEIVQWIRSLLPPATITTDIIVGFPGEEEEDYQATRTVMEQVRYDLVYSFIYSRRKYTKAYDMPDFCPPQVKQARLEDLQKRQKKICLERNHRYIGKALKVLVEKRLDADKLLARTPGNVRVVFEGGCEHIGTFVQVVVQGASPENLKASLIDDCPKHAKVPLQSCQNP